MELPLSENRLRKKRPIDPSWEFGDSNDMKTSVSNLVSTLSLNTMIVVGLLAGSACDLGGQACDASASSSVGVRLVDTQGEPTTAAGVEWRLEGEAAFQPADCVGASDPCDEFVAGWEVAGDLEIQVTDCPESAVVVMVEQGECHVITEQLDLVVPAACAGTP
jgi:hypothetical protein